MKAAGLRKEGVNEELFTLCKNQSYGEMLQDLENIEDSATALAGSFFRKRSLTEEIERPAFPVNALPPVYARYTEALAESLQVPVDMVGVSVLALLGGGGAFAYFKFIRNKPKTKGNDNLDDYDYGEDDTDRRTRTPGRPRNPTSRTLAGAATRKARINWNDQYRRLLIQLSYIVQNEGRKVISRPCICPPFILVMAVVTTVTIVLVLICARKNYWVG